MSRTRFYSTLSSLGAATLLAARLSIWLIPFSIPAQEQPDDPGVAVDAGAALIHRTPIQIPADVATPGTVTVEVTLDAQGDVTDARVLSGPQELRRPVLTSVLNWHYAGGPASVQIKVNVAGKSPAPTRADGTSGPTYYLDPGWTARQFPATLASIAFEGISGDAEQQLRGSLPFHQGDVMQYQDLKQLQQTVSNFDSHLKMTIHVSGHGQFGLLFAPPSATPGSNPAASFPPPADGVRRVRVGGNVMATKVLNKVMPRYPVEAKQQRMQGTVSYAALIGSDGQIVELRLISGETVLADAALQALRQWTYQPTLLNGSPVEVVTQIDVNFTLAK